MPLRRSISALLWGSAIFANYSLPLPAQNCTQSPAQHQPQAKTVSFPNTTIINVNPQDQLYVDVSVAAYPGPYGLAVSPSGGSAVGGIKPTPQSSYNYPSIVFLVSATPLLTPKIQSKQLKTSAPPANGAVIVENVDAFNDPTTLPGVNGSNNLQWMNVKLHLQPLDDNDKPLDCGSECLRVIGLLPGTSTAASNEQIAAAIADAVAKTASAVAPAIPTIGSTIVAATAGAQVIFDTLFPPKTVTYQYAFLNEDEPPDHDPHDLEEHSTALGWFFKENSSATPPISLLGIQTGMVMLQTTLKVAKIEVTSETLTYWDKKPSKLSKNILYSKSTMKVPIYSNAIDYSSLQNLDLFPALIPKDDVIKIMHFTPDTYDTLTKPGADGKQTISTTPDRCYVMKSSLLKYMTP
jgi:hypothetical protein